MAVVPPENSFPRREPGPLEWDGKGAGRWYQPYPSLVVPLALLAPHPVPSATGCVSVSPCPPKLLARETFCPRSPACSPHSGEHPVFSVHSTPALLGERVLMC